MNSPIHILDRRDLYLRAAEIIGKPWKGLFMCNVLADLTRDPGTGSGSYPQLSHNQVATHVEEYFPELWKYAPPHVVAGKISVWYPSENTDFRRQILRTAAFCVDLEIKAVFPHELIVTREMIDRDGTLK